MTRLLAALAVLCLAAPAHAHEFWIEPLDATVPVGGRIEARTFVGSEFLGEELGNFASMQRTVDVTAGGVSLPIAGEEGRLPALQMPTLGEGLHILRYESRDFQLTYDSYDKYLRFLVEAQREDLAAVHDARGLSRDNIREIYFRYAKSLVAVGKGEGADTFLGMPFELVALTNPYTAPGDVTFELRFLNEIAANHAIHVFHRAPDGSIDTFRLRTDAAGTFAVPSDRPGFYMVNAINILPASPRMEKLLAASWQSLWASSTYAVE